MRRQITLLVAATTSIVLLAFLLPAASLVARVAEARALDAALSAPSYLSLALTLVVAGVLVATPLGARLAERLRGPWWVRAITCVVVLTLIEEALRWPLGMWYESHLRDYGLSTQSWATWSATTPIPRRARAP